MIQQLQKNPIHNSAELKAIKARVLSSRTLESGKAKRLVRVCMGGGCLSSGSSSIVSALKTALSSRGLLLDVEVMECGCMGPCSGGPLLALDEDQTLYRGISPKDVEKIVERHILGGEPVEEFLWKGQDGSAQATEASIDFFKGQDKIVLRNCGKIPPTSIEDYISVDGFFGIAKVLSGMKPEEVIEVVEDAGLRGRGGAGFPTAMKWKLACRAVGETKYILCNADEGDPGAFMDRSVLEGDPFSVIEGMLIGAFVIGAKEGFVYVRAEYPLAVERLQAAIDSAKERGLLGENILGSGFDFNLEIRMGSGAFVCGEETALIESIEGRRGEPRPRPPFPAQKGLWGAPTVLNNVETYANIPAILLHGSDWYASRGTEESKGTKVFALAGSIQNAGLVEVPIGTSLGELVYDIGGGTKNDRPFKAAQMGGPSGGCIPRQHLNVPLDYKSLQELGAIMGSGGMIVMDEDTCMVDVARFFLEFVQEESCGKCVPCRVGTKRMLEILERICAGEGEQGDIEKLIELGEQIKDTSLCGLGQTAPNPVLSTIRHFREEYEEHIHQKFCRSGTCAALVRAPCQCACPANVDIPGFVSLTGEKRYAEALQLHRERNPFAAICARVCFHTCESMCRRSSLDDAVSIRGIKRFMVDQEITVQMPEIHENPNNAKRKVAIVGGGPAGLSCAYFLARLGYKPVVFEAEARPGGMLVQAIPAYRLPRETVAREIRMIEQMGVDIRTQQRLGKDFTLSSLHEDGFECVFMGIGVPGGVQLDLPGCEGPGVIDGFNFLKEYNQRGSAPVGIKIVIVGGGNCATDAARTAIRLGAEVDLVYRRSQAEMPAYAEEIDQALQEGVRIHTLTNPTEIIREDGKIVAVECLQMKLGDFDRSGRRRPIESQKEIRIEADQVIFAIGQSFDFSSVCAEVGLETVANKQIRSDKQTGQTSIPWIFSGGDAATGPLSVIDAIAGGERAAVGMDCYLTGSNHAFWRNEHENTTAYDPDADPVPYPREALNTLPVDRRRHNFDEVDLPWTESVAIRQAKRCLRCDYGK
ncbi:FAD-dependent oxidoreductase [Puniceicoccales bacterium CK1056]|uniref:FAD-dependent oxidoreductase n=1 Tax=Oceanipulchritudo coccoides TaxID=2706888 RepID=A0A6B2M5Z5_9BACT|nr:FAD-dependent oxidoreductase [Oceanipulchritudo coccoides]NDV63567.1 FAD-dependent oxidoreductase [Oceanipulchritudo coccoides]